MRIPPYTLSEASELCAEFQFLEGKDFGVEHPATLIQSVVVSPFEEAAKESFLLYLHIVSDAARVLDEVYNGLLFDVLVIGKSTIDCNELVHKSLHKWGHASRSVLDRAAMSDVIKSAFGNTKSPSRNIN